MGEKLDGATAQMTWQAKQGVVLPPALLESSLVVIADTVKGPPEENALVTSFSARMAKVASVNAQRRQQLTAEAVVAVRGQVYPAFARMTAALESCAALRATQTAGVGRLPEGLRTTRSAEADDHHRLHARASAPAGAYGGEPDECGDGCAAEVPGTTPPDRR